MVELKNIKKWIRCKGVCKTINFQNSVTGVELKDKTAGVEVCVARYASGLAYPAYYNLVCNILDFHCSKVDHVKNVFIIAKPGDYEFMGIKTINELAHKYNAVLRYL